MTSAEIRQKFIDFFKSKGHVHVPSSSLVPHNDPTLLFTNAGMNQFKDTFLGLEKREYTRAVTAQKCVRAGGKHNDLDEVGFTARHHTFFEMLGNFSFGDYFKEDALAYAWEFITSPEWLGLPKDRLWVSIYKDDEQAFDVWHNKVGVPADRIVRLGEKDNFWRMGDTGPCGPCSEIFWDMGPEYACDHPDGCRIDTCGCDRWREFWNNVFMQYNQTPEGLVPLERTGVDTGLGLERMATIMQGVWSNWDIDLWQPIFARIHELSGKKYEGEGPEAVAFRVIADHARCCTFLIADGVRFSNEGRGYVMRRILRRAVRFGRVLGFAEPFIWKVAGAVADVMGDAYPEVRERLPVIQDELRREEERFLRTLEQGMNRLEEILARMRQKGETVISGQDAFVLYDTYGFPLDIVRDVAREQGFTVDEQGYQAAMAEQRARARAARDVSYITEVQSRIAGHLEGVAPTRFVGYTELAGEGRVLAVFDQEGNATGAGEGSSVIIVLDRTPFYAEGGGQVGDTGQIVAPGLRVEVEDCRKLPSGHHLHYGTVQEGFLEVGQQVEARVDARKRKDTQKNHTATHLLHKALREVLGTHVQQAGSLVAPDRLRFDFTHTGPMTPEQIAAVEEMINAEIEAAEPVTWTEMPLDEARALGAMALFGEKYGEIVRVVSVGDGWSRELCGGCHVSNTSEVQYFKILSESGIGGGVRRIEAVTGPGVIRHLEEAQARAVEAQEQLRSRMKEMEKELEQLRAKLAASQTDSLVERAQEVGGVKVVAGTAPVATMEDLRNMTDAIRAKLGSGVVVLGAVTSEGKVNLVAAVTKDLAGRVHAGNLIREVARICGGGGGGRPDMATAGGKNPERLGEALNAVPGLVGSQLGL
ncbi:alanine--tRNA ligase [Symbiobacterium thermophilum]|uniref:Alanine--tRNA ligase n=1 Tax=Symbiobacterium thermophilum (strain DSM 24528 / JCM 14929 / IAM 14863 / T) TaxID=292459 RepID=SYA_SYMTH|nr:alanine--tRNA ligase [Symbiobacterium thermophilum]Q67MV8.1 RecName: Full=Alanine--tRNA ligase; AltName: Full=Alanyl-tRNA synthetase; Short=AlaRS [Symbiobacterium thermophilum IAM 14863]BAD40985.1 alanyl-tRNA synthetase [Symbiobacterium thermophilum IAM 14863]